MNERGLALLMAVVFTSIFLVVGVAAIRLTRFELHGTARQTSRGQAFYIAEAGIQRAVAQLAWDRGYAGTYTTYRYPASGTTTESYGGGNYAFSIEQDPDFSTNPTRKLVTSTGTRDGETAQIVSHVEVQPFSSTVSQTATPTAGFPATPTPGSTPTPTATPNEGSPFGRVCDSRILLGSYTGTARLVNTAAVAGEMFNGNIFSNDDVAMQLDVAAAISGSGTVRAGGDFVNAGTGLSLLSDLSATLSYEGSYQKALLDGLTHVLYPLAAVGVHFSNGANHHGTDVGPGGIPEGRQWIPDWERMRRRAQYVVTRESQPFGTWDSSSGTWVVNAYTFPTGSSDLYYVEGNVQITGISLTRTASPTIAARGWISARSITVLSTGLLSSDVQNVGLIAEGDVGVGRTILNLGTGAFESISSALAGGVGIGINLAAVASRMNLFTYSEKGEAFVRFGTVDALARIRPCVLAREDATLARTASALSKLCPLDYPAGSC